MHLANDKSLSAVGCVLLFMGAECLFGRQLKSSTTGIAMKPADQTVAEVVESPISPVNLYSQILMYDSKSPKDQEILSKLSVAGISTTTVDHDGIIVFERDWGAARVIVIQNGGTVVPLEGAIALGQGIPEALRADVLAGNWSNALQKAVTLFPDASTLHGRQSLARVVLEAHSRAILEARQLSLPSFSEWQRLRESMARVDQIHFLCTRIPLVTGPLNENDLVVPRFIQELAMARRFGRVLELQLPPMDAAIDPFAELARLKLTYEETSELYPYMATDWTLLPASKNDESRVRLHPTSRYSLCVLLNNCLNGLAHIREYELSEDDWRDSTNVATLIARSRALVIEKAKK